MRFEFNFKNLILGVVAGLFILSSCAPVMDIAYFQNKVINDPEKIDKHAGIVIQPKDMLSIVVSSRNPELALMFNLMTVQQMPGAEVSMGSGQQRLLGYVVDNDGKIDFPVLGPLEVAGLTRWELSEMIKKQLLDRQYLTDAVVTVEFMNFKISVIGEVTSPGTYAINGDKVTILQAISMARDLTIYGERNNVSVIRERNGERVIYEVDLRNVDLFKSPAYYLQQNDIVYVQPNRYKERQSTVDNKSQWIASIAISSGSILVSVASIVTNFILMQKYL